MKIVIDDLKGPEIAALLEEHLRDMEIHSPPESRHALNLDGLRKPDVSFWSAWENGQLVGCGALKKLDLHHAEIKSMRTATAHLRKGVATQMLEHILNEARKGGYRRISLETGAMDAFQPARALYSRFGFTYCEPFAEYSEDRNSVFMTRQL